MNVDLNEAGPESEGLSKRDFLKGLGAAGLATAVIGGADRALGASTNPYDVIIVGAGNAGLPTAIFAAQRDAKVLLIDAAPSIGGTLILSTGQMSAAGTKLQKSKGIEDSPQAHYDDIMRISRGTADPVLVRLAVDNAAPVFDWLTDNGLTVHPEHPVTGTTHEPYSRQRYAWGLEGGMSILKVLDAQIQPEIASGRVTLMTGTEVTELIQRDGAVHGVVTKDDSGAVGHHLARNVVLTCGGYTYNPDMFNRLEGAKTYSKLTLPYSQGAGIRLGLAAGGYVRGGDHHTPLFGAVMADDHYPSTMRALVRHFPLDRPPWEIFVNRAGKRFLCEDVPSHNAYEQSLRVQPDERCWVVFDDEILRKAPPLVAAFGGHWSPQDTVDAFEKGVPMFYKSDTLEGLARAAGFDGAGFVATAAAYNRAQASGQDPLGRKFMPLPIVKAPFYAIQLQSWNLTDYAGIAVDGQLRVVRKDGTAVGNLYAAGELLGMGQLMGQSVCGGMSVTPALALGRLLGREILTLGT
jgi:fumarate reductase flavoprotein subunit